MESDNDSPSVLSWNPRGLNDPDRRTAVHTTIAASSCHIVCLQETKLAHVDQFTAAFLGGHRLTSYAQRPAAGTRGGILLLWDDNEFDLHDIQVGTYCLSAMVCSRKSGTSFKLTGVYGPTTANLKDAFFAELVSLKPPLGTMWLALGDFNQILRARDKSNLNINRSRMRRFRQALQSCELVDIHLQNWRFTWSNERETPTLSRIDGFFCNEEWDLHFSDHILHALSSSLSDHCPLLLACDRGPPRPKSFKFENIWTKLPGFLQVVSEAWAAPTDHVEPCHVLSHKLAHTGRALRRWSSSFFSGYKVQLHMAQEIILRLDSAQENRQLFPEERDLRARLKRRVISLAVLERSRKKQCARINNLKEGDANTRYFHLRVNGRRRKNYIKRLMSNGGWVTSHTEKETIIHDHFSSILHRPPPRPRTLNWNVIHGDVGTDTPLGGLEIQ